MLNALMTDGYFNNKAFKRGQGISGNHYDIQTGEEYWISGVKKSGKDRHWAGSGKIMIDSRVIDEYLSITGEKGINLKRLVIVDIEGGYPIDLVNKLENGIIE